MKSKESKKLKKSKKLKHLKESKKLKKSKKVQKSKKLKLLEKICSFLLISIVLLGIFLISFNFYVSKSAAKYIYEPDTMPKVDAVMIFGALVYQNGTVSHILQDRLDRGLLLYKNGSAKKIIVSGDHGQVNYDEVNSMRKYLEEKGVPRKDIFMDHAGFDTYNSIYRARDIFKVDKVALVSQKFHVERAIYISRQLDVKGYGLTADSRVYRGMAYYKVREVGARFKAFMQAGLFKSKPVYLGEEIPIWKDGSLTDDGKS